ncbi:hypothetical protein OCU04_009861 [Sclerotinia nivalis]|uniref:Uncharacterized protein n=1 Tax=Sclerotinia nivalis TaxID=352851 RepID=A0A9X0AFW2_9HELO|nr:hypothetical protein OCU04_009861 [Sclerotinia nivalis]
MGASPQTPMSSLRSSDSSMGLQKGYGRWSVPVFYGVYTCAMNLRVGMLICFREMGLEDKWTCWLAIAALSRRFHYQSLQRQLPMITEIYGIYVHFIVYLNTPSHPNPNLPPHSLPNSTSAHSAFPSAATPESPTVSTPSKPIAQSIPLPTIHLLIAPTVASIAAVPYPQSSSIFSASTLFATTAHPKLLAAAGTSYSHMTMRIGNNFVEDETSRAVDTEFGRVYFGRSPRNTRGEKGEEVRKRMERWKLNVERAQRRRKNIYWKTMGCLARRRKFVLSVSMGVDTGAVVCFSIRAHVR